MARCRFIFSGCLFNRWSNKCGLAKIILVWKKEDRVQYRSKDYTSIPRYWYYCTYHVPNLVHGNLMYHANANVSSFHLGYISATPDKSHFVSIVVTARSIECRRFQVTECCGFCAEIISHLYEVFWWKRDIGKSRFFLLFVILYMYKDIELKIKPCHFILIGGTTQSNRLSTHADSVTIDQKSSLPACISCPTLRKNVGRNVLKNPLLRVCFYVFWYYSCKILKSVERELRDLFPGICSYRDRVTVAPWKSWVMTTELWEECDY